MGAAAAGNARGKFDRNGALIFRITRLLPGDQTAVVRHCFREKEYAMRLGIRDLFTGNGRDSGVRS